MKSLIFSMLAINEFGKERANPFASPNNNLKLTDTCGCTTAVVCRDSILIVNPGVQTITSIDFAGKTYSTAAPVINLDGEEVHPVLGPKALTDAADIIAWLVAIAQIYEVDPKIDIVVSGSDFYIQHYGAKSFSNLVVSGAAIIVEDRCCDVVNAIQFKHSAEGAIGPIDWNAVGAQVLPNTPYNYAGVPATDAATAAQLEIDLDAALTTLGVTDLMDVTVTVDDSLGEFTMSYWSSSLIPAVNGALPFANCASKVAFTCALPTNPV